mgnify:CR=1 FL=1
MEETENISNLEIDRKEGVVRVSVNPKIYSMDVIYGAAHAFTRDSYVLLDGDEEIEIVVELKPMDEKQGLEELGRKFCNRLLSYQLYRQKIKENEAVRNLIIYRALASNSAFSVEDKKESEDEKQCSEVKSGSEGKK